ANAVIAHNPDRLGKELWTAGAAGNPIELYAAYNEQDEARYVIERVREYIVEAKPSDIAILYRSNAQSRNFEEQLIQHDVAYRVYGGLRYFDRAEVKDALAYLRLVANRHDDAAFERAVNTPPRGIGERTIDLLRQRARRDDASLWDAALAELATDALAGRAKNSLRAFLQLIDDLARECLSPRRPGEGRDPALLQGQTSFAELDPGLRRDDEGARRADEVDRRVVDYIVEQRDPEEPL